MKIFITLFLVLVFLTSCNYKKTNIQLLKKENEVIFLKAKKLDQNNENLEAVALYKKANSLGNKNASIYLARIFRYKIKDYKKMIYWYQEAYNNKNETAAFELAFYYEKNQEYNKANKWYLKVENNSNSLSLLKTTYFQLGYMNYFQLNDIPEANKHFNKISSKGYGKIFVADIYKELKNDDTTYLWQKVFFDVNRKSVGYKDSITHKYKLKDYLNIKELYNKVNLEYDENSAYEIARIYYYLYKNYKESVKWYKKAHELGHKNAAFELALLVYSNLLKDYKNAKYWYLKSYEIGNIEGIFNLALIYDFNLKDYAQSLVYYKKAYDVGHKGASRNIELIYQTYILDIKMMKNWSNL